jgi:hypothetical protein
MAKSEAWRAGLEHRKLRQLQFYLLEFQPFQTPLLSGVRMRSRLLADWTFVRATSFGYCPSCGNPTDVARREDNNDVIYCGNPDCPAMILWKWEGPELAS